MKIKEPNPKKIPVYPRLETIPPANCKSETINFPCEVISGLAKTWIGFKNIKASLDSGTTAYKTGPIIARRIKGKIVNGIDGPTFLNKVETKTVNEVIEIYTNTAITVVLPINSGEQIPAEPEEPSDAIVIPFGSNPPQIVPNKQHNPTYVNNKDNAKTKPDKNNPK